MEERIFFRDKSNTLKGPFTERQVQEWYRKGWFESSFPFYFTRSDERPFESDSNGITIDSLRSLNGIGCPFINPDECEKSQVDREKRMERIEKEITELQQDCDAALSLEKTIERAERQLGELTIREREEQKREEAPQSTEEPLPEVAPTKEVKESIEEIGDAIASFLLEALDVYASGDYDSWDDERKEGIVTAISEMDEEEKKTCERILVEKMKEKEFFCCVLCDVACYNYKQALVHFTSDEHIIEETESEEASHSQIEQFRSVLKLFSKLPNKLREHDEEIEAERFRKFGLIDIDKMTGLRPTGKLLYLLESTYCNPRFAETTTKREAMEIAVSEAKGPCGKIAMAKLHKHLRNAPTFCVCCNHKTGDRDGFYTHLISSVHMKRLGENPFRSFRFCLLTMLVNTHRKDLI